MACISDTSLWLHNKLGTSNDSWTSGSICSQLNKEVLRNIKDCFPDLQTQVKLKLLLSFFHIPRRLVEEWKNELEEIIEIAGLDSELWVSMIAETIKTFPNTGSLNTEISDYEETRPIFSDMVNDLRKLINKHSDIGMLPLECQYLNKAALISVVGQQAPPVKHFTIKKKPKSAALKTELLQKCMDAQSIKKTSAPTIPLRSRGMPRKMTDTTPLKGIPSRVPSSGFRTPTSSQGQNRPNMSRTPAGRKDGGIKLLDIADQPLGYAAAKKRKRQQELEDQQKRALEAAANPPVKQEPVPVTTTPDYAAGLTASTIYTQPATPASVIKEAPTTTTSAATNATASTIQFVKTDNVKTDGVTIKNEVIKVESISTPTTTTTTVFANQTENISPSTNNNNQIVFTMKSPNSNKTSLSNSSPTIVSNVVNSIKQESPRIVQQNQNVTLVTQQQQSQQQPASTQSYITPPLAAYNQSNVAKQKINVQSVISSLPVSVSTAMPTLTALSSNSSSIGQQQIITQSAQQQPQQIQIPHQIGATKIVQIKTAPTIQMANAQRTTIQNIPPLIPTQQPTILNIRNVSIAGRQNQIQTTNASNISYITTSNSQANNQQPQQIQIQQQQIIQQQQPQQQQQIQVSNAPKYSQVVMSPNVKGGNTIILANPNVQTQKTFILRTIGADGKTTFQQVPLSNLTGLNLGNNTNNMTIVSNPPSLIKTSTNNQTSSNQQQIPALVPTSSYTQNVQPVVITPANQQNIPQLINQQQQSQQQTIHIQQQPQQQGTTIIRQAMPQVLVTNQQGGVSMLPQGLTLIQRPGQQPQLVQTQTVQQQGQQQQIHRTIITAQPEQQMRQVQIRQIQPQQIIIQNQPATIIQQQQPQQQQQQQQQQPNYTSNVPQHTQSHNQQPPMAVPSPGPVQIQSTSPPQTQQQQRQPTPPQQTLLNSDSNSEKPSATKSTLNVNAKPFTPRNPSTPNPSRPHTPQTPQQSMPQGTYPQPQQQHIAQQMMVPATYIMQQSAAFQAPQHPHATQQTRFRKSNNYVQVSQMQVAAAAGQPLLAPAPIQQFVPFPAQHPQHFQSQGYPQMVYKQIRMFNETTQQPPIQYLTPSTPSTTPSPGQPHQQHQQYHIPQPSPAGGGPQYQATSQAPQFQMMCPLITAPLQQYYQGGGQPQHHPPQFQVLMSQQHPAQ